MTVQCDPDKKESQILHKYVDFANRRVIEIGCGEGRLTWNYASASAWTMGMDADKDALRVATIDCPANLVKKVHFARANAERLPYRKDAFDIAVLAWSL